MNHRTLLKELVRSSSSAGSSDPRALPPRELRFVLEYAGTVDPSANRTSIRELLESDNFELVELALDSGLDNFLILRLTAVERTLPNRDLFEIGYTLADELGLVSAEPDLGTDFYVDPEPGVRDGVEANVVGGLCWEDGAAPADKLWALKNARIDKAWSKSRGAGVVIGQPDTGVADHVELEPGMLNLGKAYNILTNSPDPTDPLDTKASNPGHGTGTSSVAASRQAGQMCGAAPEATLAPIRCIDDVKVFDASPVAAAIAHATRVGCHVISMSLGGVPSRALRAAIRNAIEANLIVVSAAGNCVRTVVWPARYDEVIAVGGTNIQDRPWKGSSRGGAVDICAPAEFVWRAERNSPTAPNDKVEGGQGTSFATALTAGTAALWLSHHGRDNVIRRANALGCKVQDLFRAAVVNTARVPAGWDANDFGSGILDAEALLNLPLAAIVAGSTESADAAAESVHSMLDETFLPDVRDPSFNVERFAPELATIALTEAQITGTPETLSEKAKVPGTRPSPRLSEAARRSSDRRLRRFAEIPKETSVSRPPIGAGFLPPPELIQIAVPKRQEFESTGRFDPESARAYLQGEGKKEQLQKLEAVMGTAAASSATNRIVESATLALDRLAAGAPLERRALVGLEALVRLNGRPALRVRNDSVDIDDPRARDWHDRLYMVMSDLSLQNGLGKVGRIDVDDIHFGTGFVAGPGLVLTNRHVLQGFAAPVPRANDPQRWIMTSDNVTIDFADTPSSTSSAKRFRIRGVVGAGPIEIPRRGLNFAALDAALLDVETVNSDGTALPAPLEISRDPSTAGARRTMLVIGYPARPVELPRNSANEIDPDVVRVLNELYGADYGTKYLAPGEIMKAAGSWPEDVQRWTLKHDATTLGGNSGSCVLGLDSGMRVVALHFAGSWLRENFAHSTGAVAAGTNFLSSAALNWVP